MPKKINEIRKEEFLILYNKGLNDYEIAENMQISDSTICRWRNSFKLKPHNFRLRSRNSRIELTQENKEILCGTLLGDSSIQYYKKYRWAAPIYKCDHGENQKEYAELLAYKLSNLNITFKEYYRLDKRTNKMYTTYCVKSACNPTLFEYYNELYNTGKKEITSKFLENFTIKSLAYLYMDDGYADQHTAYICTDNFSEESKKILKEYLKKVFNLHFSIVNHGKYYRMRLSQCDFPRFCELVKPYIIKSLQYKLNSVS